jgi:UV DNA damage endonuclease
MAPKRKASSLTSIANEAPKTTVEIPLPNGSTYNASESMPPPPKRQRPSRRNSKVVTNPDNNSEVLDGQAALRASPDHDDVNSALASNVASGEVSPLSDVPDDAVEEKPVAKKRKPVRAPAKKAATKSIKEEKDTEAVVAPKRPKPGVEGLGDPEADGEEEADEEEIKEAMLRPPPVHSDILPLPWKGRLGYVCESTSLCKLLMLIHHGRRVFAHTSATPTPQSSAPEHAA